MLQCQPVGSRVISEEAHVIGGSGVLGEQVCLLSGRQVFQPCQSFLLLFSSPGYVPRVQQSQLVMKLLLSRRRFTLF